jgi:2-phosphosulfolactate phosphatase
MKIKRLSLIEGAKEAQGLTVIIDVFRAFTTAAYVMANGAEKIIPLSSVEQAFRLREEHPNWIIMGEVGGKTVPGFDYGNSPADVKNLDFTGRTIIQRTSAGTQGIANATQAEERMVGSFVIAEATVEYIKQRNPEQVSLVAMGWGGKEKSIEDELFAEYIKKRLTGLTPDFQEIQNRIRNNPQGAKFFDPDKPEFREEDFYAAMALDRFNFALKVETGEQAYIRKVS